QVMLAGKWLPHNTLHINVGYGRKRGESVTCLSLPIFLVPKQRQEECAMQAKAAVLYAAGTPLRLEEVEVLPPQRGEVQVRMYAGGVCLSDLHVMKGDLVMPMPIVLGHVG